MAIALMRAELCAYSREWENDPESFAPASVVMKQLASKTKFWVALASVAVFVVIGVFNLRDRLRVRPIASDRVYWTDTAKGIEAKQVEPDSPLAGSVTTGSYLRYVYYKGRYERMDKAETVSLYLDRIGVGGEARYVVERQDAALQNIYSIPQSLYDVDFQVQSAPQKLDAGLYMALIGVVYLAIGLFVLFKQSRAELTYHFLSWFVASFVVYFYSSTNEFNTFDKCVDMLDKSALVLLAPLFFHFCLRFPSPRTWTRKARILASLFYLPAIGLIALEVFYHYRATVFPGGSLRDVRGTLDKSELVHYAVFFLAGSGALVFSFVRTKAPLVRQQLKWIIWGLGLSVVPFVIFYLAPYLADIETPPWMTELAYAPLILIPLSFGYSIIRYRLMDVDVIMRKSFVHVAAATAIGAVYMVMLLWVGDLVKFVSPGSDLNSWRVKPIVVAGMLIVAMLFAPLKNRLQVLADRWFYGDRYTLRAGLQDFGRMLAQTTALPKLLDSIVKRLSEVLSVKKIAIFIEDAGTASGFRLAHERGLASEPGLPENIKTLIRGRSIGRGFISADDLVTSSFGYAALSQRRGTAAAPAQKPNGKHPAATDAGEFGAPGAPNGSNSDQVELYYYVPCVVRDRMVAILGLSRPSSGGLLSSEDTDLLRALSGYVAVAIDNSLLHRSEMQKAEELARLKEFSENIIEGVSVGIVAVDVDGRVTTWNSTIETMFGIERDNALGRDIAEVLDKGLVQAIQIAGGGAGWAVTDLHQIYKYQLPMGNGDLLTLNISLAPFEAAQGLKSGALIVVENASERAVLEQQLQEREKLSSIGLLAAGVAHEVNTPLAGISSYSQMLLQQVPDNDPKHVLLEKIVAQTARASGIISNLLNFSRTGNAQFRELDINRVLDDTLQLLEPQLRNTSIHITRDCTPELPAAYGDAAKLQQVFMNLILNARDAMPAGGKLTLGTRQSEQLLIVDFKDTGIGIPPENIARIYDPFFTTKEVGQGTGLGLALSYGIVQEHGGRIFVESRPGEGTHFIVTLPTSASRQMQIASD